jgi:hypothetical protein
MSLVDEILECMKENLSILHIQTEVEGTAH